jgi:hypothetical protein
MTSDPMVMYRQYTAELDTLTAEQVTDHCGVAILVLIDSTGMY